MSDSLPFTNQKYNDSILKIAIYKLIEQAPGIVSWTLDSIIYKLSGRTTPRLFKEILPTSQFNLLKHNITIRYPDKKKVNHFWICKKLIQLLLWTENKRAVDLGEIWDNYKISYEEIYENILKAQQIMSDYANHLTFNPALLGFNIPRLAEIGNLPSYQNATLDSNIVGTSNFHLTSHIQQNQNFSETNGHSHEHNGNNSFTDNMLSYCFDGIDKYQARRFINDYDNLGFKNKWSLEEKAEYFPNNLEKDALNWYLCISPNCRSNWQELKTEFMAKYLFD
jgi:hypothetical protein